MKKTLIVLLLSILSINAFAQEGEVSGHAHAGYQSDYKRFGVGFQGRYGLTNEIRIAPDITVFFPKNKTWGVDINWDVHYVCNIASGVSFYPLAGLNVSNNRTSATTISLPGIDDVKVDSRGFTNFGFNLGGGIDYDLSPKNYLNFEMKYTFSNRGFGQFMFGYGFRF